MPWCSTSSHRGSSLGFWPLPLHPCLAISPSRCISLPGMPQTPHPHTSSLSCLPSSISSSHSSGFVIIPLVIVLSSWKFFQSYHCYWPQPLYSGQWPPLCSSCLQSFFYHGSFAYAMIIFAWKNPPLSFPSLSWLTPSGHSGISLNPTSSDKALFSMWAVSFYLLSTPLFIFLIIYIYLLTISIFSLDSGVPWDHGPVLFGFFCA